MAQNRNSNISRNEFADSLKIRNNTSDFKSDTLNATDSIPKPIGDITTTVKYYAKDSIRFNVDSREVFLYGNANVRYGDIELTAAEIVVNYGKNSLYARGVPDSTGKIIGKPIFKEGDETYQTSEISYNFKTRKAFIKGVITRQGEGLMHGNEVKKNPENELYVKNAKYTTCNLADPHFYIFSSKLKVIPRDKVLSGPFYMAVSDVPTPFGFPLGMFPAPQNRTSGIIFPSYGEEKRRGFFLRNGGYFWAISDYANLAVTGDIYTKGSWGINANSTYRKRYKYNGTMRFNFTSTELDEDDESVTNDFRITWSHTPTNVGGTGRFSVNVNAATTTYNQNNSLNVEDNIRATLNSSVSYSKNFTGTPFSMGANARFTQNLQTKEVTLSLPDLTVNMGNVNPFLRRGRSPTTWWEKTVVKYSFKLSNRINNRIDADSIAPFDFNTLPELFKDADKGMQHDIPISTSFNLFKFFTFTPNFNYKERWYFERINYGYDPTLGQVQDTVNGFYRVSEYSTGIGVSSRIYGTLNFKEGRIRALRHVMNPSLSFNYRPDFSDPKFGIYQEAQISDDGTTQLKNRYQGAIFGSPGAGRSGNIGFGLANSLELKVMSRKDSVEKARKVPILKNLQITSGYNIYADKFNLSNFNISANTSIYRNFFQVNVRANIDPYIYVLNDPISYDQNGDRIVNQTRVNRFSWNTGEGIGSLRNLTFRINTNLNPKAFESQNQTEDRIEESNYNTADKQFLIDNPDFYVDFTIPWNLRLNYSLSRNKIGFEDPVIIQSLQFSGDLRITNETMITFTSGYDFENKDFTQTQIGVTRNLHCWEMLFNWVPFGNFESFEFTIRVKSSILQDLQLNRRSSFFDNR